MRYLTACALILSFAAILAAQNSAPSLVSRVDPEYSDEGRRARAQGTVVLSIVVGEDGKARDAKVAQGAGFGLDEKALEAIGEWQFRPATKDGKPVAAAANVEMNFRLLVKDKEDHTDQVSRLIFTLPEGAYKPELTIGKLPANPITGGDQAMKIRFEVDADGIPKNIVVLTSTDKAWGQLGPRVIQDWRFRPASLNGNAIPTEGVLELSHSSSDAPEAPPQVQLSLSMPGAEKAPVRSPAPLVRSVAGLNSRVSHTATLLNNGTVLLAGGAAHKSEMEPGSADFFSLASAQIFDWVTRRIVNTSDMVTARANHTATLLRDGTVLLVGGKGTQALAAAEIYDPSTGKFSATGSLHEAREHHTAALLPDGRVLICGGTGVGNKYLTSAEIYDPRTRAFTLAGNMTTARTSFRAVVLKDGKVLLLGGFGPAGGTGELYDPVLDTFRPTGKLSTPRYGFSATLLDNAQVLIAGGSGSSAEGPALISAELYDSASGAFHATAPMASPREFQNATPLANRKVLISGGIPGSPGSPLTSTEVYDPASGAFAPGPMLIGLHTGHTVTQLQDGSVLVAGSGLIGYGNSAELLLLK